jgi:hypothetical protein
MSSDRIDLIIEAWVNNVFRAKAVTDFTPIVYPYLKPISGSSGQRADLKHDQEYNFIQFAVSEYENGGFIGCINTGYTVQVQCIRDAKPKSDKFNDPIKLMRCIEILHRTALGTTWGGTVDRSLVLTGQPQRSEIIIGGRRCIRVIRDFNAERKQTA